MYPLSPPHVFVHKRVYRNPLALERLERMLSALGDPPIEEVDTADLDRIIELTEPAPAKRAVGGKVRHGLEGAGGDPSLLFNTFVWDPAERTTWDAGRYDTVLGRDLARVMHGVGEDFAFSRRAAHFDDPKTWVCQGGWGIHSMKGCVHRCKYCHEGYCVNLMLDVEAFAERVCAMMARRPAQKVYRYDLFGDSICFEPEYGASRVLADAFAATADKYLLFYTKSNNVEHLVELPDKSHCLFYLTLSTETVCRDIELGAPSMTERLEALRQCQEAGFPVRVGFSPIIPVHDWRREATECLEQLFAAVQPETIRLWVLSLMSAAELEALLGSETLAPEFQESLGAEATPDTNGFALPFSLDDRVKIYAHYLDEARRLSPTTPVTLCSERRAVWDRLADRLTLTPETLHCCCGQFSPPLR